MKFNEIKKHALQPLTVIFNLHSKGGVKRQLSKLNFNRDNEKKSATIPPFAFLAPFRRLGKLDKLLERPLERPTSQRVVNLALSSKAEKP